MDYEISTLCVTLIVVLGCIVTAIIIVATYCRIRRLRARRRFREVEGDDTDRLDETEAILRENYIPDLEQNDIDDDTLGSSVKNVSTGSSSSSMSLLTLNLDSNEEKRLKLEILNSKNEISDNVADFEFKDYPISDFYRGTPICTHVFRTAANKYPYDGVINKILILDDSNQIEQYNSISDRITDEIEGSFIRQESLNSQSLSYLGSRTMSLSVNIDTNEVIMEENTIDFYQENNVFRYNEDLSISDRKESICKFDPFDSKDDLQVCKLETFTEYSLNDNQDLLENISDNNNNTNHYIHTRHGNINSEKFVQNKENMLYNKNTRDIATNELSIYQISDTLEEISSGPNNPPYLWKIKKNLTNVMTPSPHDLASSSSTSSSTYAISSDKHEK